jgi:hypothetical protein
VLPEVKKITAGASGSGSSSVDTRRSEVEGGRKLAGCDVLGPLDMREENAGAAHFERVIDLPGRIAVVQRRRDQTRPEAREVVDDEVDSVRHQGRDAIARLHAEPAVAAGQRGACLVELAPAERACGRTDRDLVRGAIETGPQQVMQRRGGGLELGALEQHLLDRTATRSVDASLCIASAA